MPRINTMSGGFTGYTSLTAPSKDEPEYLGSKMVFAQAVAPTGWTKETAYNEYALRIVDSSFEFSSGGSVNFTSVFNPSITTYAPVDGTWPFNLDTHTISTAEMESHRHSGLDFGSRTSKTSTPSSSPYKSMITGAITPYPGTSTLSAGAGGGHSHPGTIDSWIFNDTTSMDIKYLDVIIARY